MSILEGKNLKEICNLMQLQKRVKEFDGAFKVENLKLVCVYCNVKLDHKHKPQLEKHVSSKAHLRKQRLLRAKLVRVIEDHESDSKDFNSDADDSNDEWESNNTEDKTKLTVQEKIQFRLKEFGKVLKQEGDQLLCAYCNHKLKYDQRLSIIRHLGSKFHEHKVSQKNFEEKGGERPPRRRNTTNSAAQVEFNIELCKVFLVSGISLSKLYHPIVKQFFTKYTTMTIPVESTLRKSYLEAARLTLQTEAERLKQEMLNKKNKKHGAKGRNLKRMKRSESSDDEEDPLVFTEEQLESMLSLKVEPKEEPTEEPMEDYLEPDRLTLQAEAERLKQEMLNKNNKKPEAKGRKSKRAKQSEIRDDEENPLAFIEPDRLTLPAEAERLKQEMLNKNNKKLEAKGRKSKRAKQSEINDDEENPLVFIEPARLTLPAEAERLKQEMLNKNNKKPEAKGRKSKSMNQREIRDEEEDPLAFTEEQLESMLSLKVEPKEEPTEEPMEESVQDPVLEPKTEEEIFETKEENLWN